MAWTTSTFTLERSIPCFLANALRKISPSDCMPTVLPSRSFGFGSGSPGVAEGDVAVGAPLEERADRDDVDGILGQPGLEDVVAAGRDPERRLARPHDGHGVLARAPVHDAVPDALLGEEALGLGDHDGGELPVAEPPELGPDLRLGGGRARRRPAGAPTETHEEREGECQQGAVASHRGGLLHSGRERRIPVRASRCARRRSDSFAARSGSAAASASASMTMRAMAGPQRR